MMYIRKQTHRHYTHTHTEMKCTHRRWGGHLQKPRDLQRTKPQHSANISIHQCLIENVGEMFSRSTKWNVGIYRQAPDTNSLFLSIFRSVLCDLWAMPPREMCILLVYLWVCGFFFSSSPSLIFLSLVFRRLASVHSREYII